MSTQPLPDEELIEIFDTAEESEAMVVRGLLESAGIDALISALDNPQDVFPVGGVIIRVPASQAEEARRLIEEYRTSAENDAELNDEDSPEEA
jgi:hypothetical protein